LFADGLLMVTMGAPPRTFGTWYLCFFENSTHPNITMISKNTEVVALAIFLSIAVVANALISPALLFVQNQNHQQQFALTRPIGEFGACSLHMVGGNGKGWSNDNFLDGLGGNDQDRQKSQDEYQEFKESREAFVERQATYKRSSANSEAGRRFMKDRANAMNRQQGQQQRQQGQQSGDSFLGANQMMTGPVGFEQMLGIPLDYEGDPSDYVPPEAEQDGDQQYKEE
jgi:hypothetical protein